MLRKILRQKLNFHTQTSKIYYIGLLNIFCLILLSGIILGCKSNIHEENEEKLMQKTDIELYQMALQESKKKGKDNVNGISTLDALEQFYPSSQILPKALVLKTRIYYDNKEFYNGIFVANEFLKLYPTNSQSDYITYLKALCYYDQMIDTNDDQGAMQNAVVSLNQFLDKFPNSIYTSDVKLKLEYTMNALALKELVIGKFYFDQKNITAAIVRFHNVVSLYNNTKLVPEALYKLIQCYMLLGVMDEANKYYTILQNNFSNTKWCLYANTLFTVSKNNLN